MASKQKKTTMAKLNREAKTRERRADKMARKDARKRGELGDTEATVDEPVAVGGPVDPEELERALANAFPGRSRD